MYQEAGAWRQCQTATSPTTKRTSLWIDPERKVRWETYLDETSGFQYLSQLIRHAVEREIGRDEADGSALGLSQAKQLPLLNPREMTDDQKEAITSALEAVIEVEGVGDVRESTRLSDFS